MSELHGNKWWQCFSLNRYISPICIDISYLYTCTYTSACYISLSAHGRLWFLTAGRLTQLVPCKCREKLEAEAAWAAILQEREEESKRQARILRQQQQAQHAKHEAAGVVRAVPAMAGKRRLDILYELQELVDRR